MKTIKSALYLDFDNILGGLLDSTDQDTTLDQDTALELVRRPAQLLYILKTQSLPNGVDERDILIRRAYLNPDGKVPVKLPVKLPVSFRVIKQTTSEGLLLLRDFRPYLTQAGFEVVDCPLLTSQQKNTADIRVTIDILERSEATTRYDEFIIASSDSDFAPLCHNLRAKDHQVMVIGGNKNKTVVAYQNTANCYLNIIDLFEKLAEEGKEVWDEAKKYISNSDKPVLRVKIGQDLRSKFSEKIKKSNWFGMQSFENVVRSIGAKDGIHISGDYVWDVKKHVDPVLEEVAKEMWDGAKNYISNSDKPVLLAKLSQDLQLKFGETIEKSNWFGTQSFESFVRSMVGAKDGIRINEDYVWDVNKHPDPDLEEAAKEMWDGAKNYISNSDKPVLLANLAQYLQSKFGETIGKSNWFGRQSFENCVRSMGDEDGIRISGDYVLDVNKHAYPKDEALEKVKEVWDVAKNYISNSDKPVLLGNLAQDLRSKFSETIEKSNWFSMQSFENFVRSMGAKDGIRISGDYVLDVNKHAYPKDEVLPDLEKVGQWTEEAKKVWSVAKKYISNSDKPVLFVPLVQDLRLKFGEKIEKSNWFGMQLFKNVVRSMGAEDGIRISGDHILDVNKHVDPIPEEVAKEMWNEAKNYISNSDKPVLLAKLAQDLQLKFGETIEKSNWFGMKSFENFVRSMGTEDGIRINEDYVWDVNKHPDPVLEEAAKEMWDMAKNRISNSDKPVLFVPLVQNLRLKFGEKIEKSNWFGRQSFESFVRSMGAKDGIRISGYHVLDVNKHADPKDEVLPDLKKDEGLPDLEEEAKEEVWDIAKNYISNSDKPVLLANLGQYIRSSEFGETIEKTNWFGRRSITNFVLSMRAEDGIRISGYHVLDVNKHAEPGDTGLPKLIEQFCQRINLPRISSEEWKAATEKLADYAATHKFNLTECSKWTRDNLAEDGFQVARSAINFIMHSTSHGGKRLDSTPPPSTDEIREGLLQGIINHPQILPLNLSDDEKNELESWICGKGEQT